MRRGTNLLYAASRILFSAAVVYWFMLFFVMITGPESCSLNVVYLLAGLAAVYTAGQIASAKGIAFWPYAALSAVLVAAGIAALNYGLHSEPDILRLRILTSFAYAVAGGLTAKAAASDPKAELLTIRFDVCVVLSVAMLLTQYNRGKSEATAGLALFLASMLAIVACLALMRSGDDASAQSGAGRVIPYVMIAVTAVLSFGLYKLGSGGAKSLAEGIIAGIKAAWHALGSALLFIWTMWTRFCAWLASFFPEQQETSPLPENITPVAPDIPDAAEPSKAAVIVLYIMTALVVLAALYAIYQMFRSIRLRRKGVLRRTNRKIVRKGGGLEGLRAAFAALAEKLRYKAACIRYRNTAAGLLSLCEARAPKAAALRKGESGQQFLRRIASALDGKEKEAVTELAELVEKDFYSGGKSVPSAELCKNIKRCRFMI